MKTFLITDNLGNGIVTAVSNDPTFVINMPPNQIIDVTKHDATEKATILSSPENFVVQKGKVVSKDAVVSK